MCLSSLLKRRSPSPIRMTLAVMHPTITLQVCLCLHSRQHFLFSPFYCSLSLLLRWLCIRDYSCLIFFMSVYASSFNAKKVVRRESKIRRKGFAAENETKENKEETAPDVEHARCHLSPSPAHTHTHIHTPHTVRTGVGLLLPRSLPHAHIITVIILVCVFSVLPRSSSSFFFSITPPPLPAPSSVGLCAIQRQIALLRVVVAPAAGTTTFFTRL
jgi:hypothetical protein